MWSSSENGFAVRWGEWDLDQTRLHNKVNEIDNDDNHANAPSGSISGGSWVLPVHDAAGNMTRAPRPGQESQHAQALLMVYDAWNRPVKVYRDSNENGSLDGNDALVAEYRYDGLNRRIAKLIPNGNNWDRTDYYYNEAWQCLEERCGANQQSKDTVATAVKVQYLWDVRYVDAPVLRWRDTGGDPDLDETLYFCNDANMNVTALVDGTAGSQTEGEVVERVTYDPYGKPTFFTPDWSESSSQSWLDNEILYCGYRFDPETGLYHVRHRHYHPTLGRWASRDGEYWDGPSLYEYVTGSPLTYADWTGLALAAARVGTHGLVVADPNLRAALLPELSQFCDCFDYQEDGDRIVVVERKGKELGSPPSREFCCCYYEKLVKCNIILMYAYEAGKGQYPRTDFNVRYGAKWTKRYTDLRGNFEFTVMGAEPNRHTTGHELTHGVLGFDMEMEWAVDAVEALGSRRGRGWRGGSHPNRQVADFDARLAELVQDRMGCDRRADFSGRSQHVPTDVASALGSFRSFQETALLMRILESTTVPDPAREARLAAELLRFGPNSDKRIRDALRNTPSMTQMRLKRRGWLQ
ncbi:MAG: RHS repeat-associated core domain-containing protein [Planctomycetes bacterium]|nr:RHS repeat-associated core domain-containing protein [Planctomycetota bacterium]